MRPLKRRESQCRRNFRPSLEGLETRDLPSAATPRLVQAHAGGSAIAVAGANVSTDLRPLNPGLIPAFVNKLYGPITTTTPVTIGNQVFPPGTYAVPQPTSAELRRESLVERFTGRYVIGTPRFSNQSATIHIFSKGANATSNQFLHARSQIILFTPADPAAKPTTNDPVAGMVTGLVSTFPQSFLQSSSYQVFDVTNVPGVASNDPKALDHGLPSHLAITWDPVSGGTYATPQFTSTPAVQTNAATGTPFPLLGGSGGAVAYFQGTGFLDIKYVPDAHPRAGTRGSGTAVVTIQGLVNTTGATDAIAKQIN
jgi:hypothetical protein